jgi:hypothetical protein
MPDYSFFALLFAIATTLAPAGSTHVVLENTRHAEQRLEWTRGADGRWAMTINGREMGRFVRDGDVVVHDTGVRAPDRFSISELADPSDLRRGATRVRLRGPFAPGVLRVDGGDGALRLTGERGSFLPVPLRLRASP